MAETKSPTLSTEQAELLAKGHEATKKALEAQAQVFLARAEIEGINKELRQLMSGDVLACW